MNPDASHSSRLCNPLVSGLSCHGMEFLCLRMTSLCLYAPQHQALQCRIRNLEP